MMSSRPSSTFWIIESWRPSSRTPFLTSSIRTGRSNLYCWSAPPLKSTPKLFFHPRPKKLQQPSAMRSTERASAYGSFQMKSIFVSLIAWSIRRRVNEGLRHIESKTARVTKREVHMPVRMPMLSVTAKPRTGPVPIQ